LNVASTVTIFTDYHAISSRVEDFLVHFSPREKLLATKVVKLLAKTRRIQKQQRRSDGGQQRRMPVRREVWGKSNIFNGRRR
jgi:hypothetical protein